METYQQLERPEIHDCAQCEHDFDDHVVMPTAVDPADGGIILCPSKGCLCFTTWSVANRGVARIPDPEEIELLREQFQEVLSR